MDIDIFDIGQIYFINEDIKTAKRQNKKIDNFFSGSYILGVLNFFLKFLYFICFGGKAFPRPNKANKVLFYGISRNNRVTLEPIIKEIGVENVVSFVQQKSFPSWKLYWHALPHFFSLLHIIRKSDKHQKQVFKLFFPKFWRMYGCPPVIDKMLNVYQPEVVVMANDHQEFNRCLLLMCKERGIKTVYVQHASVGTRFPSLQFSYSLLDGTDAYNKYKAIGDMRGEVYLTGGVRFDVVKPSNYSSPKKLVIGVAINLVDNKEKVKSVCLEMKKLKGPNGGPVSIMLRPHPQMQEGVWKSWCCENGIMFSSPKEESSFDFIEKATFVVANQCSIHLDTAMCHKVSIVYNMSLIEGEDVYLFKQNGLVDEVEGVGQIQSVINSLSSLSINEKAVQYYSCSYGTTYEGKVAHMIKDLIDSILYKNTALFNEKYHFKSVESGDSFNVYKMV